MELKCSILAKAELVRRFITIYGRVETSIYDSHANLRKLHVGQDYSMVLREIVQESLLSGVYVW